MDGFSRMLVPVVCLLLISYFSYHGLEGRYGLYEQEKLAKKVAVLRQKRDVLEGRKTYLEHKIGLLKPGSISADYLDELARKILNFSNKNDAIIWSDEKK